MTETSVKRGYVIAVLSLAADGAPFTEELFVHSGDPNWLPKGATLSDKCGRVWMTPDLQRAKFFDSAAAATDWMCTTSTLMPLRPDGKPNRPFTAYNVEFVPVTAEPE